MRSVGTSHCRTKVRIWNFQVRFCWFGSFPFYKSLTQLAATAKLSSATKWLSLTGLLDVDHVAEVTGLPSKNLLEYIHLIKYHYLLWVFILLSFSGSLRNVDRVWSYNLFLAEEKKISCIIKDFPIVLNFLQLSVKETMTLPPQGPNISNAFLKKAYSFILGSFLACQMTLIHPIKCDTQQFWCRIGWATDHDYITQGLYLGLTPCFHQAGSNR